LRLVHIHLPDPVDGRLLWFEELSLPVFASLAPMTFVFAIVTPGHFSVAVFQVFCITSMVPLPVLPSEYTLAVLHVIFVLSMVLVAVEIELVVHPFSLSILLPVRKQPDVNLPCLPLVFSESVRESFLVLALVHILVCKCVRSLAVFKA
jgi:hypothetical protein